VSHLGWVVRDVDATAAAWRALSVANLRDGGVQEVPGVAYRGTTVVVRDVHEVSAFYERIGRDDRTAVEQASAGSALCKSALISFVARREEGSR
jgi:hypothetical protein